MEERQLLSASPSGGSALISATLPFPVLPFLTTFLLSFFSPPFLFQLLFSVFLPLDSFYTATNVINKTTDENGDFSSSGQLWNWHDWYNYMQYQILRTWLSQRRHVFSNNKPWLSKDLKMCLNGRRVGVAMDLKAAGSRQRLGADQSDVYFK